MSPPVKEHSASPLDAGFYAATNQRTYSPDPLKCSAVRSEGVWRVKEVTQKQRPARWRHNGEVAVFIVAGEGVQSKAT